MVTFSYDDTTVISPDAYGENFRRTCSEDNAIISLQHLFSPTLINNARVALPFPCRNNLDCCINIRLLAIFPWLFRAAPGSFTVTGSRARALGAVSTQGFNDFHYNRPQS